MQKYIINLKNQNIRLDKFLKNLYKNASSSFIYKSIRKKKITVNGKKVSFNYILKENDIINSFLHEESLFNEKDKDFLKTKILPKIIFEDENIIIVFKERQTKMHDSKDSLLNQMLKYLYKNNEYNLNKEESFKPAFCNRLDKNTSGLVIMAKNQNALKEINSMIKNGEVLKKYRAVVFKKTYFKNKIETAYIIKDKDKMKVLKNEQKNSKKIITKLNTKKIFNNASLLEIDLITGRKHQIRAHLSYLGFPIIGDETYGNQEINKKLNIKLQALSAEKISFNIKNKYELTNYLNKKTFKIKDNFIENITSKVNL